MDAELLDLLVRARAGDVEAFGEVAVMVRTTTLRAASALLADRHEAEDAAQDALLLAFEGLPALRELEAFPGWLMALVRTAASRRTRRRRPDLFDPHDGLDAAHEPEPAARLVSAEVREAVREAVRGLTPALQSVLERHHLEGRGVAEIAATLGLPLGTVKRRLHDARERLRPRLLGLAPGSPDTAGRPRPLRLPLSSREESP